MMSYALEFLYYLSHPQELLSILEWWVLHKSAFARDLGHESHDMKQCFHFLDLTSRSFATVIKDLHPELLGPTCIFYLALRGLDTIEDDMTIDIITKEPILRSFHTHLDDKAWSFNGNGPSEKDRELLVNFHCVTREFTKIKEEYKVIIRDITKRMGGGMADFAKNAVQNTNGIRSIKDYELYCHHVAGIVGEGMTRLFVEAKFADPVLLLRPELAESMGQFLQQTNVIRDIREDYEDKRYFWPEEIWSQYVESFADLFEPTNHTKALHCSSHMTLLALKKTEDCLTYMAYVQGQPVFKSIAIPLTMAIATLTLCFQNLDIFDRKVRISKGVACNLMVRSTSTFQLVCGVFRKYAGKIRKMNKPGDPKFFEINAACEKIVRFTEGSLPRCGSSFRCSAAT